MGDFLLRIRVALGSVCSSCLRDPSGYRAHHGAILGQGTLIWGHAAALQRGSTDFAAFPLPPSKSPFPSHPHPCSPGWLSRTIPERLFSFLCLIFPLFPSNHLPREEQLPRGDPPRSSLHGPRGAADDGSTLPSASPRAQHHAVEVRDGTKPTEKLSVGSQCCEAPKSQP